LSVDAEGLLPYVRRPGTYVGNEFNSIHKDHGSVVSKVVLAYPDRYDIGMSNLGFRIVYHLFNGYPEIACERFFAPWPDMEEMLRSTGRHLFALESHAPVTDFDIVAFSVGYELTYTNLLNMLDLSGIPLRSEDRTEDDPLVIAGGPCATNPEPISSFIDCFFIGDGEETVRDIAEVHLRAKREKANRKETLLALSEIEGSYVPLLGKGRPVARRICETLSPEDFPGHPILPNCEITHDRLAVEIMRGCPGSCRFCQSAVTYGPARRRNPDDILKLAEEGIRSSGWEEMSLVSLSPTDYPDLAGLIGKLEPVLAKTRTALSLSSVRADSLTGELASALKAVKKTSITLAPEAGTERMRNLLGKPMTDDAILESAARAYSLGFNRLKLYFIIGLPGETDEDVGAIADLSRAISNETTNGRIKLSVSSFVPKAHTPFEREGQNPIRELSDKARRIKSEARSRRIDVSWHDPRVSFLEAVVSRGDEKLGHVIMTAFKKGCRFDGWTELFDFEKWISSFEESGLDPAVYTRSMKEEGQLPWDFIKTGRGAAGRGRVARPITGVSAEEGAMGRRTRRVPHKPLQRVGRYRVKYMKLREARFTSHLDVMRAIVRTLRRARIPLAYSQGFSARPRVSFGPPLSVGMTSVCEYFDFMTERLFSGDLFGSIVEALPPGLKIASITPVFVRSRSLSEILDVAEYRVTGARLSQKRVDEFLSKESCEILQSRGDKKRVKDVRPLLLDMRSENGALFLRIHMPKTGWVGPAEILSAIEGRPAEDFLEVSIERTGLYTLKSGVLLTPTAERVGDE